MESQNDNIVITALKNLALKKRLSEAEQNALDNFAGKSVRHQDLVAKFSNPRMVRQMLRSMRRARRNVPTEAMWSEVSMYIRGENMPLIPPSNAFPDNERPCRG